MEEISESPGRSGGIDFDRSDVQADDVIGRDKIELNLPSITQKGCYAQLSENIKFAIFLGVLLLVMYTFFRSQLPRVTQQTPTPTVAATVTPTATQEPATGTPVGEDQPALELTGTAASPTGDLATPVDTDEGTPLPVVTSGPDVDGSVTPALRVTATATEEPVRRNTPVVRPATPTPRPTPTLRPTQTPVPPSPSPHPSPTPTPRPPTPTSTSECASATVRLGPVVKMATVGDVFSVSARVSCAVSLAGYQVRLAYDPAVVIVRSANNAGFLSSAGGSVFVAGSDVDNNAGTASISAVVVRPGPYPSGSGTLASFALEAVGRGSTELGLSVGLSDSNAQSFPVDVHGGAVIVQPKPSATPSGP